MRCLGIVTDIAENGYSRKLGTSGGGRSHFDEFLSSEGISPLTEPNSLGSSSPQYWQSTSVPSSFPSDIVGSCMDANGITGPDILFLAPSTNSLPVYTGTVYEEGKSLQNLQNECDGSTDLYLMTISPELGVIQEITDAEKQMLCDIGYSLNDFPDCDCQRAAAIDFGVDPCGTDTYTVSFCPYSDDNNTIIIYESDLLSNDNGVAEITWIGPSLTTISSSIVPYGNGVLTDIGPGEYSFQPDHVGRHTLVYFYNKPDCGQTNIGVVYINAVLDPACEQLEEQICNDLESYLDCPSPLSSYSNCYDSEICVENPNPCNLVCNPAFCARLSMRWSLTSPEGIVSIPFGSNSYPGYVELPNWYKTHGRVSYVHYVSKDTGGGSVTMTNTNDNNGVVGSSGIMGTVSLPSSGNYLFSIESTGTSFSSFVFNTLGKYSVSLINSSLITPSDIFGFIEPEYDGIPLNIVAPTQIQTLGNIDWKRYGACFEVSDSDVNDYNSLWIKGLYGNNSIFVYDNVELIKDNFSAGEDEEYECNEAVTLGGEFCMLSGVTIEYDWSTDEETLLRYQVLDGEVTVLESNTDFDEISQILTVWPTETTTYYLERKLIDAGGINDFALCVTEDEVVIDVDCCPLPEFSFDEYCNIVEFQSNYEGSDFSWDFGDGTVSSEINPLHTYETEGTYEVVFSWGSENELCTNVNTQTIIVQTEDCNQGFSCEVCDEATNFGIDGEESYLPLEPGTYNNQTPIACMAKFTSKEIILLSIVNS